MVRASFWTQQRMQNTTESSHDLFEVLGVGRDAKETEVRRAFKTLITKEHPDKGGRPDRFKLIKLAYDTLSNRAKRQHYEKTGKIARTAAEDFMDRFREGSFGEHLASNAEEKATLTDALTVLQKPDQSHTAGFEAWMRSRGDNGTATFTAESMAEQFGVVKGSYESVLLPKLNALKAVCCKPGNPRDVVTISATALPAELEWGEVLVSMKYAPIDAADIYTCNTGGIFGSVTVQPPFTLGHQGLGIVSKVGPGVKTLKEDDWVIPVRSHLGTWRNLVVVRAADVLAIQRECLPPEYAALAQQLCLAYRLLEDFGKLKPGDCVVLNAATGTVGQAVIQLCSTLQLRTVAVVSEHGSLEKTALWLKSLGATEVVSERSSIKLELEKLRFFAKPKLALDAVGGKSAMNLAEALAEYTLAACAMRSHTAEKSFRSQKRWLGRARVHRLMGGQLVVYGCLSGRAPVWPWQSWVFKNLQVQGFNFRSWMNRNTVKVSKILEALGRLIKEERLKLTFTEYDFTTEFEEALQHAMDRGTNTKILFKWANTEISEPQIEADES